MTIDFSEPQVLSFINNKNLKRYLLQAILCQSDEDYDEVDWDEELEDSDVYLQEGPAY